MTQKNKYAKRKKTKQAREPKDETSGRTSNHHRRYHDAQINITAKTGGGPSNKTAHTNGKDVHATGAR
jgi:hypothetical protein